MAMSSKAERHKAAMAPTTAIPVTTSSAAAARTPLAEKTATPANARTDAGVKSVTKPLPPPPAASAPGTPGFTLLSAATVDKIQDATPEHIRGGGGSSSSDSPVAVTPMPVGANAVTPAAPSTILPTPATGMTAATGMSTQSSIFAKMRSWVSRRAPQLANYTINESEDSCIGMYVHASKHAPNAARPQCA